MIPIVAFILGAGLGLFYFGHWSQVKEIRKKSSKQKTHVKLIENKQFSDFISLWVRVKD